MKPSCEQSEAGRNAKLTALDVRSRRMRAAVLGLAALVGAACSNEPAASPVRIVTKASVSYTHFTTIQAAVDAANPGDWILIDVGTYNESVLIMKPHLHVRGMDRN